MGRPMPNMMVSRPMNLPSVTRLRAFWMSLLDCVTQLVAASAPSPAPSPSAVMPASRAPETPAPKTAGAEPEVAPAVRSGGEFK